MDFTPEPQIWPFRHSGTSDLKIMTAEEVSLAHLVGGEDVQSNRLGSSSSGHEFGTARTSLEFFLQKILCQQCKAKQ